jgi:hypothetical protein
MISPPWPGPTVGSIAPSQLTSHGRAENLSLQVNPHLCFRVDGRANHYRIVDKIGEKIISVMKVIIFDDALQGDLRRMLRKEGTQKRKQPFRVLRIPNKISILVVALGLETQRSLSRGLFEIMIQEGCTLIKMQKPSSDA